MSNYDSYAANLKIVLRNIFDIARESTKYINL